MSWFTQYPPQSLDDLVLSSDNRKYLQFYLDNPLELENISLYGPTGTGKTTIANLIAKSQDGIRSVTNFNIAEQPKGKGGDNLRKFIDNSSTTVTIGGEVGRLYIINESNLLTESDSMYLAAKIDKFGGIADGQRIRFIFTHNRDNDTTTVDKLLSRLQRYKLEPFIVDHAGKHDYSESEVKEYLKDVERVSKRLVQRAGHKWNSNHFKTVREDIGSLADLRRFFRKLEREYKVHG